MNVKCWLHWLAVLDYDSSITTPLGLGVVIDNKLWQPWYNYYKFHTYPLGKLLPQPISQTLFSIFLRVWFRNYSLPAYLPRLPCHKSTSHSYVNSTQLFLANPITDELAMTSYLLNSSAPRIHVQIPHTQSSGPCCYSLYWRYLPLHLEQLTLSQILSFRPSSSVFAESTINLE